MAVIILIPLVSLGAWLYLLAFRGGFWRADRRLPEAALAAQAEVAIIVPARNEAATIGEVVAAHLRSEASRARLFLADDGSTDGTAEAARMAAGASADRLTIVKVPPLPAGWSGKLFAVKAGLDAAEREMPQAEWVLLTDADIEVAPDLLPRLLAEGERKDLSLVSVMAELDSRGFWAGLLIPAFVFFFQKLYPFALTADPKSQVAGAAGGVVLIRRDALAAIGGIEAVKGALIDDCSLASAVKNRAGRKIALYLSRGAADAVSLRDNRAYGSIRDMVARTAFTQLSYNWALLAGTLLGLALLYLSGPLALLTWPWHGQAGAAFLGAGSWALMAAAFRPTLAVYRKPPVLAFALPLAAALYGGFTLLSALRHARGGGGRWKGRTYPARAG